MKILATLSLFFGLEAFAQKPISAHVFQVNVRPALSAVVNDFYQMIALFPEFPKEIISLLDKVEEMGPEKEDLKSKCPRQITKDCLDTVLNIQSKLSVLQGKTMELISHQKMSSSLQMTNISGIRLINDFQTDLEEIKMMISNSSFMIKAGVNNRKETYQMLKKLDQLGTNLSLAIVEFVPHLYRDDFRHFYFNFIHPLQQQVTTKKNVEFLNRNMNSLNFSLNLFNMNLTKRNKKTPEGMAPYLSLMHNRWNSLLRSHF